ncbi:MAG: hypothetical protein ACRCSV_02945 [Chlamydiales bacterium]
MNSSRDLTNTIELAIPKNNLLSLRSDLPVIKKTLLLDLLDIRRLMAMESIVSLLP